MDDRRDDDIGRVAALNDPLRRRLFRYVMERREGVSRDEAARELAISRSVAAFHLDRLAANGLLDVSFRRPDGRTGPGAGRPSKYYRRSESEIDITIPPRRYELAAHLLARAVERTGSTETRAALAETARSFGELLGEEIRDGIGGDTDAESLLAAATDALEAYGYAPEREADGSIRLRNCPFHALAVEHQGVVCGMNLELFRGLVRGMRAAGLIPELRPAPDRCCVVLHASEAAPEE